MSWILWMVIGIAIGLVPFALVIYFLKRPELWWPRR